MRVLWFSNPGGASGPLGLNLLRGEWIAALEKAVHEVCPSIDLHLCFDWKTALEPFQGISTYHPVRRVRYNKLFPRKIFGMDPDQTLLDRYLKVVDKVRPDVIHVHGSETAHGLVAKHTRIPTMISIQGILTSCDMKYYSGIPRSWLLRGEPMIDHLLGRSNFRLHKVFRENAERERLIYKSARYVMGRTEWDRRTASILAPDAKYFHGEELLRPSFSGSQWSRKPQPGSLNLLSVISNAPYKGFEVMMRTAKLLVDAGVEGLKWRVVGLKPESSTVRVVKRVLGSSTAFEFLGEQDATAICSLMQDTDLFVQTSHIENSPNSLCEAMAFGLPVVASLAGGTGSLLRDGVEGILIQDGDPWCLAGAVLEVSRNPDAAVRRAELARGRAMERHDRSRVANSLLDVYRELASLGSVSGTGI